MKRNEKIKLGISIGDLNGIGCEVALKAFEDDRMLEFCTPVLFASSKTVLQHKKALGLNVHFNTANGLHKIDPQKINVVNVWKENPPIDFGKATEKSGEYALKSFTMAVAALKEHKIDVLVTAPINKNNVQTDDFKFPGHTDYLAKELKGESLMFMVADDLRVGLLTDHIAVKDVANAITPDLIRKKVTTMMQSLKMDFGISKPKIAILGINPHSGDNGTIGEEDDKIMKPTITRLFDEGILVYGPYSADSFFGSGTHKSFDAVLAAYHDQGLIPFKTLAFGKGVNFTAGLEKVRTSPDHGTAYEIAGKNKADETSFKEAVFSAIKIYKNREDYLGLVKNPLKSMPLKKKVREEQ